MDGGVRRGDRRGDDDGMRSVGVMDIASTRWMERVFLGYGRRNGRRRRLGGQRLEPQQRRNSDATQQLLLLLSYPIE